MMDNITPFDALILILATWRLSHLMVKDTITQSLRNRLKFGLWHCVYCFSIWSGAIILLLWLIGLYGVVWILALSGGALMLRSYTGAGLHD